MATAPTVFFPGYELLASGASTPAQGIFIPLADLAGLSAAEADTTTGDGRKVVFEILRQTQTAFTALDTANRPTKMNITAGVPTGVSTTEVRRSFTLTFDVSIVDADVSAEP